MKITNTGLDGLIDAFRDVQTEGVRRAQDELDRALQRAADASRGLAHVHEGSLRASQQVSSDHDSSGWSGSVAYSSRGAQFELQRGGEHSAFVDDLAAITEADFERAMDAPLRDL